ncbi:MAG: hypothetical protein ABL891_12535 [Burkholderiales bacterium]
MQKNDNLDSKSHCVSCGVATPGYDSVNFGSIEGGYRLLCTLCFNTEAAAKYGLDDFENIRFDQIVMADCAGAAHTFHFRTRLLGGTMVALDAFELRDGEPAGYQFEIIGDPEDDLMALLGRLIERMRRRLSVKHIEQSKYGLQIVDKTVRAQISSDDTEDERVPLLEIDGQEVTWEEFGRMLMTFEGWQFRMEIADRSEEV